MLIRDRDSSLQAVRKVVAKDRPRPHFGEPLPIWLGMELSRTQL